MRPSLKFLVAPLEIIYVATFVILAASAALAAPPDKPSNAAKSPAASPAASPTSADAAQPAPQDADEAAPPNTIWMKKKLDYAQQILGGIAEADYDRIAKNASSMKALSRIEGFVRGRTPGYRTQLQIFQDATEELLRQAEKENVDGASLAFTQLTISCVNCHKQLRESMSK
ncbi:MAG: hypothetical protein U1A77_19195 [Pirellulales bacterium]